MSSIEASTGPSTESRFSMPKAFTLIGTCFHTKTSQILLPVTGVLAGAFLLLSTTAFAIDQQREMPIDIISDSATINDESGLATYTGNVVVSQGTSRLEADSVQVYMANKALDRIEAHGNPARFNEQQINEEVPTTGHASKIVFESSKATLTFQGDASLNQASNSFSGEQIVYDINAQAIRAKGDASGSSRVKIQYLPGTPAINATPSASQRLSESVDSAANAQALDAAPSNGIAPPTTNPSTASPSSNEGVLSKPVSVSIEDSQAATPKSNEPTE